MWWHKLLRELVKEIQGLPTLPSSPVSEKQASERAAENTLVKALGLSHLQLNPGPIACQLCGLEQSLHFSEPVSS